MSSWVVLAEADVTDALPTDMAAAHVAWVSANPEKEGRLGELTVEALGTCRAAVESGAPWALDSDETTVPTSGYRHMINMVIFNLGIEMSYTFPEAFDALVTRADIWLRSVQVGSISIPSADGTLPSPSYEPPEPAGRVLGG
jgi:hypothetical protein